MSDGLCHAGPSCLCHHCAVSFGATQSPLSLAVCPCWIAKCHGLFCGWESELLHFPFPLDKTLRAECFTVDFCLPMSLRCLARGQAGPPHSAAIISSMEQQGLWGQEHFLRSQRHWKYLGASFFPPGNQTRPLFSKREDLLS